MKEKLQAIKKTVSDSLNSVSDLNALEEIRIRYLGKKGELTALLKGMGALSAEERPKIGALANEIRANLEKEIEERKKTLSAKLQA